MGNRPTSLRMPFRGSLKPRKGGRMAVCGVILAVAAYLVLDAALRPLLAARTKALASIELSEAKGARLADPARVLQEDGAGKVPVSTVVTRTAAARDLTIRRIEPAGAGTSLSIEKADFNDIIRWFAELEIEQGLRIVAMEMDRTTDPGIVNATMTVRR